MTNCCSPIIAVNQLQNLIQSIGVLETRSCSSSSDLMKNPFRRETISSQLAPSEILNRIQEQAIPYESIVDWNSPMEGYKTFVKESLVGDKLLVAKIQGSQFQLIPIGILPAKGQSPAPVAGALFGRIDANGSDSRLDTVDEAGNSLEWRPFPVWLIPRSPSAPFSFHGQRFAQLQSPLGLPAGKPVPSPRLPSILER